MKRAMSIFGVLLFFCAFIFGIYLFAEGKSITRSTEWAVGKIPTPKSGEYDVVVVGSDPEGIAAAIGAARSGAKTILLGKEDGPGGLLTYGMLNTLDMSQNKEGALLTKGIFQEFYNSIGQTESFDVENAKNIFNSMIEQEKNVEYRKNLKFVEPVLDGNVITGVIMEDNDGVRSKIIGKRIIDATQDGDVCAAAGVPYYVGMEDVNVSGSMAATLVIKVGGVNWKDIETDIKRYRAETGSANCGFNKSTAWGFGDWCYSKYTPIYSNMQLRGPNFGLQDDGTILINALQIFNVDGLNDDSKALAMEQGKIEAENVVKYLKNILTSFKEAYLVDVADELYIRETRHIQGEYVLQATDVLGNKNFYDKIAMASYPIDIQATSKSNTGYVIGNPDQYSIPYRCIVPKKIDNLFIIGRSASYSSVAAGSARVVPSGMVVGESAGISAVYTIYKDITPRELVDEKSKLRQLNGILKSQNIYLPEYVGKDPNEGVEDYEKIKKLINLGMLSGGYSNNFYFDKEANISSLCNALINSLQRGGKEKYNLTASYKITRNYSLDKLTAGAAARVIVGLFDEYTEPAKVIKSSEMSEELYLQKLNERIKKIEEDCFQIASSEGYFSKEFVIDDVLTYRDVYVLAVDVIERYIGREIGMLR